MERCKGSLSRRNPLRLDLASTKRKESGAQFLGISNPHILRKNDFFPFIPPLLSPIFVILFPINPILSMALSNNDIFKKLRVALKLRDEEIVHICSLVDFKVTKSEIGAIFRNEDHPKYMECGDQFLRNFLNGLVIHLRGPLPKKNEKKQPPKAHE